MKLTEQILFNFLPLYTILYIPESFLVSYHKKTILNSNKLLHNMVLTHIGWTVWEARYVKESIALMQRTSNVFFLKMMLSTAELWAKKDISYGGHFCRMENPVTVKNLSERG